MLNKRTIAVIKRELREKVLSKAFILTTLLIPVLMIVMLGIQTVLMTFDGDSNVHMEVVTESQDLSNQLENEFNEKSFIKDSSYIFSYKTLSASEFESYLEEVKPQILEENIRGIVFIPDSALANKEISYYSKTPKNFSLQDKLDGPINKVLINSYFKGKDLSKEDLTFARTGVDFTSLKISQDDEIKEEGFGNLILSYLFTFLLYISLLMIGSMTMQSVIEEKNNRIVEVLLSSVSSKELMTGKILGSAITGLLQMSIWLLPLVITMSTTIFVLPPKFAFEISMFQILYLLVNFFIGLITFLGLFATIGAIFDNAQDAQSGMWPVMMLIIIPFFISMSMFTNPDSPIANIASMAPFAAIIVMPGKMTIAEVPMWQFIVSMVVNIATIFLIFPFAGKIYRVGILWSGKKPKWSEVIKWLKYKY